MTVVYKARLAKGIMLINNQNIFYKGHSFKGQLLLTRFREKGDRSLKFYQINTYLNKFSLNAFFYIYKKSFEEQDYRRFSVSRVYRILGLNFFSPFFLSGFLFNYNGKIVEILLPFSFFLPIEDTLFFNSVFTFFLASSKTYLKPSISLCTGFNGSFNKCFRYAHRSLNFSGVSFVNKRFYSTD